MKQWIERKVTRAELWFTRAVRLAAVDALGASHVTFRNAALEALKAWAPTRLLPVGVGVHYPSGRDPAGGSAIMGSSALVSPGQSVGVTVRVKAWEW
jgi:hypothetical protein